MIANPDAKGIQKGKSPSPHSAKPKQEESGRMAGLFLFFSEVEMTGFEPVTPSLRTRCSAGLSYIPKTSTLVDDRRHHCNGLCEE